MLGRRHEIARFASDFYQQQFRKIMRWLIIAIIVMILLLGMIFYLLISQPEQYYYANTTEGQILAMPPYVLEKSSQ
ncbi:MAG TPA: hypothetical protein VHZ76_04580 [Gammaproteobacteria bacterium]|jgi:hypothetical protein|nr:hypothetical protein [Gammaproteobacteria bacterium]